jgi:hypothetical protein
MPNASKNNTPTIEEYSKLLLKLLEEHILSLCYIPHVHFELEGTYTPQKKSKELNYKAINKFLKNNNVLAKLKPEYWEGQWEWESLFLGQSPTKTADDLAYSIKNLPVILLCFGAKDVTLRPVSWCTPQYKKISTSQILLDHQTSILHIPNSIQISISASLPNGDNALLKENLGEVLQNCLLHTSKNCSLIFCPEEESFQRLSLKSKYNLSKSLSSPDNISGGRTGSIAYYKRFGKHGQELGKIPKLYDPKGTPITYDTNWKKQARIEHRIGSSSKNYKAHLNALYALANLSQAIKITQKKEPPLQIQHISENLPESLYSPEGAIALFKKETWLFNRLKRDLCNENTKAAYAAKHHINKLRDAILSKNW